MKKLPIDLARSWYARHHVDWVGWDLTNISAKSSELWSKRSPAGTYTLGETLEYAQGQVAIPPFPNLACWDWDDSHRNFLLWLVRYFEPESVVQIYYYPDPRRTMDKLMSQSAGLLTMKLSEAGCYDSLGTGAPWDQDPLTVAIERQQGLEPWTVDGKLQAMAQLAATYLDLCAFLAVETDYPDAVRRQIVKRVAKRRRGPALAPYHVLHVRGHAPPPGTSSPWSDDEQTELRLHRVRGHWMRTRSVRKPLTWRKPHMRGNPQRGFADKHYEVHSDDLDTGRGDQ